MQFMDYFDLRQYKANAASRFQKASERQLAQDTLRAQQESTHYTRRVRFVHFVQRVWLALFHHEQELEQEAPQPVLRRRKAY